MFDVYHKQNLIRGEIIYCPEVLSYHLQFYFERDFDFLVVIEILN